MDYRQHPLPIGGETLARSFPESNRRRSVRLPKVDGVSDASPFSALDEEEHAPVGREISRQRPVEPGQLALFLGARKKAECPDSDRLTGDQSPTVGRDVVQRERPGDACANCLATRERRRVEIPVAERRGGEPDFTARGRPGQPLGAPESLREGFPVSAAIDDGDSPAVVVLDRMVHESDPVAAWGNARVTDPAARLVQHRTDRIFQPIQWPDVADDRQILTVRRPIRPVDVLEDLSRRRSPRGTDASERARADETRSNSPAERDRELARA